MAASVDVDQLAAVRVVLLDIGKISPILDDSRPRIFSSWPESDLQLQGSNSPPPFCKLAFNLSLQEFPLLDCHQSCQCHLPDGRPKLRWCCALAWNELANELSFSVEGTVCPISFVKDVLVRALPQMSCHLSFDFYIAYGYRKIKPMGCLPLLETFDSWRMHL